MSEPTPEPVTTRVIGMGRRPVRVDTFADITALPFRSERASRGRTQLIFAGALTDTESAAIWDRLTSLDDTDLVERRNLRALLDAVRAQPTPNATARLAIAMARRILQDEDI